MHIKDRLATAAVARQERAEARRRGDLPPLPTVRLLRSVIRDKCREYMGGGGEHREDIRACTASPTSRTPCPLWPYRPNQ